MFRLYFSPGSCALASHIALEHVGADYEAVRLDFSRDEQRSPEYLRHNPKGRVPTLVTPQGVLTETPAILLYLAQSFPQAGLAPLASTFELARMNAFNSYLCSTVHVAHAHGRRGVRWADDAAAIAAMKAKVPENMGQCFALIEREFLLGPWVLGARYSVSDMYLYTVARWLESDGVDATRFPKVSEHLRRMADDPVVQKVLVAEGVRVAHESARRACWRQPLHCSARLLSSAHVLPAPRATLRYSLARGKNKRCPAAALCRQRWQLWLAIALLTLSGCAHVPPRQRLTRALIATGVAVAVTGGAIAAGCLPDDLPGACSANRDERSVKVGVPIFALGLAIITGALLLRPRAAIPPTPQITRHATPTSNDPYGPPPLNGY